MTDSIDAQPKPRRPRHKGIYWLPNLLTTGTLFGGFYAVIMGMSGHFDEAAIGILVAMIADSLDGRIARLTNTASDFGKEYDSLCDMVAFGVATSLVMFSFSLHHLADYRYLGGKLGWVLAFTYTACAALRLARFNVLTAIAGGSKDFYGLPSPAAAAVVAFFVWAADRSGLRGEEVLLAASVITLSAGLLMVSSVRYSSFKAVSLTGRVRFISFATVVGMVALIAVNPPYILFLLALMYAASGPAAMLWRRLRRGRAGTAS